MSKKYQVSLQMIVKDWPAILIIIAMLVGGIVVYPHLPELVPSHWNFRGEIDGYSGRFWGAFGLPLMAAAIYLGMIFAPYIDPKKENYPRFSSAYRIIRLVLVLFMAVLYGTIITVALGGPANLVSKTTPLAVGILFIVIGNYLPQARHNYFFGIRTPWTLANEEVWRRTHRFSGILFVLGGLGLIVSAFLPAPINFIVGLGGIITVTLFSIIYSYLAYHKVTD
ncbi:MAG: hypothetical protein PWP31_768 [Clostridia bacterium]|nr:hypothetical protein [Clostridia bacterium]